MTRKVTENDVRRAVDLAHKIYDVIAAYGTEGVPSGHLYALVMATLPLDVYEQIVDLLVHHQLVTKNNHLLVANPVN